MKTNIPNFLTKKQVYELQIDAVTAGHQLYKNQFLADILAEGSGWELVGESYGFTEGIAVNAKGEVFFQDIPNAKTYKIGPNGKPELYIADSKKASGATFSTAGDLITITGGWSEPPHEASAPV